MSTITEYGWTFGELVDHAYFLADEEPDGVYPLAAVQRLVKTGLQRVASRAGYPLVTAWTDVAQGADRVTLIGPVVSEDGRPDVVIVELLDAESDALILQLPYAAITSGAKESGQPKSYASNMYDIIFDTALDRAYTVRVTYRTELDRNWTSTDVVHLSSSAAELAAIYAVYNMKLKDDEYANADRWKSRFDDGFRELAGPHTGVYSSASGV